ncbi:MAG: hypothetical protein IJR96_11150 [Pseudobutyrivibrio sp.]|nr:hypothetical protein [Pseudobutyrivibrio sp.]
MYLISAYFDDSSKKELKRLIDEIAMETGNTFMVENNVPPHMTISSIEARTGVELIESFKAACSMINVGDIIITSYGVLPPYVIYGTAVLNEYLMNLQNTVYENVKDLPDTSVSKYYQPYSWLPHITLGKTLTQEQMSTAFAILQKKFKPIQASIVELGLAKTNPHEDIIRIKL